MGLEWNRVHYYSKKVKLSPKQAVEGYRAVECYGFHIVYTIGSQMAVKLSALRTDCRFTSQKYYFASGTHLLEAE
jgi:hypothetical protein